MAETLQNKMEKVGLTDDALKIEFDLSYSKASTKLVHYNGIDNKTSWCPVIIEGKPETKAFAWNGQWLNYFYSSDYREHFDFATLVEAGILAQDATKIEVNTIKWSLLFFNLSRHYSDRVIPAYVFGLGQTNKTLGFYPFHFKQGLKLIHIYKILFGENNALKDAKDYETLFGIHIKRACELGTIGLQALEPDGLRKYFIEAKFPDFSKPSTSVKKSDTDDDIAEKQRLAEQKDYNQNIIPFRTFKTCSTASSYSRAISTNTSTAVC